MFHCIYRGVTGNCYNFLNVFVDCFVLANRVDSNEIPHFAAFHLGQLIYESTVYKGTSLLQPQVLFDKQFL